MSTNNKAINLAKGEIFRQTAPGLLKPETNVIKFNIPRGLTLRKIYLFQEITAASTPAAQYVFKATVTLKNSGVPVAEFPADISNGMNNVLPGSMMTAFANGGSNPVDGILCSFQCPSNLGTQQALLTPRIIDVEADEIVVDVDAIINPSNDAQIYHIFLAVVSQAA